MTDAPFAPRYVPGPVGLNAEFYRHLADGALRLQRCDGCGTWRHPPRILCGGCGADGWRWERASGRGVVYSWTVTHQPLAPGFGDELPYAVVVVELDEGPRIVTAVRDIAPADLRLNLPVEVRIARASETVGLHYFVPRP